MIKTGEVVTVDDSYGVRLIEQGAAVVATEAKTAEKKPVQKPAGK
jgi:ribosomal protein L9